MSFQLSAIDWIGHLHPTYSLYQFVILFHRENASLILHFHAAHHIECKKMCLLLKSPLQLLLRGHFNPSCYMEILPNKHNSLALDVRLGDYCCTFTLKERTLNTLDGNMIEHWMFTSRWFVVTSQHPACYKGFYLHARVIKVKSYRKGILQQERPLPSQLNTVMFMFMALRWVKMTL